MPSRKIKFYLRLTLSLLAVSLLFGCVIRIDPADTPLPTKSPDIPKKVTSPDLIPQDFSVELRIPASADTQLAVDIFDEVSGMLYNIERFPLIRQADGKFLGTLMLPENATLRYRYVMTTPLEVPEQKADGTPVGYRVAFVEKNKLIKDFISGWPNAPYTGETGDLNGIVHDSKSNQPLPDVLINIAGYQTFTDMTGRFVLNNLPVGVHNLSVVSIDGSHATFQQQANLVAGLSTPAVIQMIPLPPITVTLNLAPPTDAIGAPIRLAGNYVQSGAIFNEYLQGSFASRMPLMSRNEDGSYTIQLNLHAGNVFRYKYTLGNGYINAERDQSGALLLRTITLPNHDVIIADEVATWRIDDQKPTTIIARAPDATPPEDSVSIQFFTNHAHQPIPMWPMDGKEWMFLFFGSSSLGTVTYCFARNDQADLSVDPVSSTNPYRVEYVSDTPQTIQIESWTSWDLSQTTPVEPKQAEASRLVGVELLPGYQPGFLSRYRQLPTELKQYGINWLIFTPTWNLVEREGLPYLEFDANTSVLLSEMAEITSLAKSGGFTVALYPQITFPGSSPQSWWEHSEKTLLWWQQWYAEYERFIMSFSQFANVNGIDQLIVGGSGVEASLPGAIKTSGTNFGTPKTAEQLWTDLIDKVNAYYTGQLLFAIPADDGNLQDFSFFDQVDGFYLTLSNQDLQAYAYDQYSVGTYLDGTVYAFYETVEKPLLFGINAASLTSNRIDSEAPTGSLISPFNSQYGIGNVDLASQDYFYQVYTSSLAQRDWVSGISSRGFFPVLQLTDFSSSIYGKPAMNSFISLTTQNH
jgi:hypothetical protein